MSEYNIQMNKYNALNAEYDQLYPATKIANVDGLDTALQNKLGGIESTEYPGCYYRMVDGVTEWFNPPMVIDTEYRTTERFLCKPVYVKAVDIGDAVSGGDLRLLGWLPGALKILRIMGSVATSTNWSDNAGMTIIPSHPYGIPTSNAEWDVYIKEADLGKVIAYTGASLAGRKVIITAWYTKD